MQVEVTLKKSIIGRPKKHRATVSCLGLRKINQTVRLNDTAEVRGMIQRVSHLVVVNEISPKGRSVAKPAEKEAVKKKVDSKKSVEAAEKKTVTKKTEAALKKVDQEKDMSEDKKASKKVAAEEKNVEKEVVAEKKTTKEKEVAA
jgi:large subunit ribosomal protein L30